LLCDDLTVEASGDQLEPRAGACERSRAAFATLGRADAAVAQARIAGTSTTPSAALDAAARLLAGARRPFIGGLGTDVAGMRATLRLARRLGAVVDHAGSEPKYRNLHVLREAGWITTTFAEVKNRADLVVLIGDGWQRRFPRFVERMVAPTATLFTDRLARRALLVGSTAVAAADALPRDVQTLALDMPLAALPRLFALLTALVDDRPVRAERLTSVPPDVVGRTLEWLRAAQYGVVVWAAADLEFAHAELSLQALSLLLASLNRTARFAALPLAGTDGDLTANAVHTWQSGMAYPASYANGTLDADPHRYATHAISSEVDCVLWISSLLADRLPPARDVPTIVLGRADMNLRREPAVYLPVATPGIDATGDLLRSDKVVSLHLPRLRASALQSVAQAVEGLLARLS
jgi:formylmethanofuran dehydrogenase subunit B